jgi:hypothetical protein
MVAQSVAGILGNHVRLSVEAIDRMYLNVYVPRLQREKDVAWFFRGHRQQPFASSALMAPISRRFVASLERYARRHEIEVVQFRPGERKDDVMAERLKRFEWAEGVVFIGSSTWVRRSWLPTGRRRLLAKEGIAFEALDNDPDRGSRGSPARRTCDRARGSSC